MRTRTTPGTEHMKGMRIVIAEELKASMHLDVALIKQLSGGQMVTKTGRIIGTNNFFRYTWSAGLLLVFNEGDMPKFPPNPAFVERAAITPMRARFERPGVSLDESEPYSYRADSSIEQSFAGWRSALLDILCEHYDPMVEFCACPEASADWKEDLANPVAEFNEWMDLQVRITKDRKNAFELKELKARYAHVFQPPVPASAFIDRAVAYFQNKARGSLQASRRQDCQEGCDTLCTRCGALGQQASAKLRTVSQHFLHLGAMPAGSPLAFWPNALLVTSQAWPPLFYVFYTFYRGFWSPQQRQVD